MTKKIKIIYFSMISVMVIRLFWMVYQEPTGAKIAGVNHPNFFSLSGFAAASLPYVIYPSIVILSVMLIGSLFKKRWAYFGCFILGSIQLILIIPAVFLKVNPSFGPLLVIPACILMMIFSGLMIKNTKQK